MTVKAGTWYYVECDGCSHSSLDDDEGSVLFQSESAAIANAVEEENWTANTGGIHCPDCSDLYTCSRCNADCDVDQVDDQVKALDPDGEDDQPLPWDDDLCFDCWLADNPLYNPAMAPDVPDAQLTLPQLPVKDDPGPVPDHV